MKLPDNNNVLTTEAQTPSNVSNGTSTNSDVLKNGIENSDTNGKKNGVASFPNSPSSLRSAEEDLSDDNMVLRLSDDEEDISTSNESDPITNCKSKESKQSISELFEPLDKNNDKSNSDDTGNLQSEDTVVVKDKVDSTAPVIQINGDITSDNALENANPEKESKPEQNEIDSQTNEAKNNSNTTPDIEKESAVDVDLNDIASGKCSPISEFEKKLLEDDAIELKNTSNIETEKSVVTEKTDSEITEKCENTVINTETAINNDESSAPLNDESSAPLNDNVVENIVEASSNNDPQTPNSPVEDKQPVINLATESITDSANDKSEILENLNDNTLEPMIIDDDDDDDNIDIDDDEVTITDDSTIDKKEINNEESQDDSDENKSTLKRSLDHETDDEENIKKVKVNDSEDVKTEENTNAARELFPLEEFRNFMNSKYGKLSKKHLEEYCIESLCEAFSYRSELGKTNRRLKYLEQVVDSWRNKIFSINKQSKDLDIVTNKLVHDSKHRKKENGKFIEPTPVKITRSVGLQVCLQGTIGRVREQSTPTGKRKRKMIASSNSSPVASTSGPSIATPPANTTTVPSPKTVKTILPVPTPSVTEANKQNVTPPATPNRAAPRNISTPTVATPVAQKTLTVSKAVIDLTDEDDTKTGLVSTVASTAPQNVRLITTQATNVVSPVVATSVASPRLTTYVVQPPGQQAQQVIFATSTAPTRPGQVRPTFMLRPLAAGQLTRSPRMNGITQNSLGTPVSLVPQSGNTAVRQAAQFRFSTPINRVSVQPRFNSPTRTHPAALPNPPVLQPNQPSWKALPPKPSLKISKVGDGIVLSWKMLARDLSVYEEIASYQLYAYQETSAPPSSDMWRKVGDVKALALPMACTLTQFTDGHKYHFAVRAVDVKSRVGPFSQPEQIMLS